MKIIWEDNGQSFDQLPPVKTLEPEAAEAAEAQEDEEAQEGAEETQYQPPSGTGFGW